MNNRHAHATTLNLAVLCTVVVVPAIGFGQSGSVTQSPQNFIELDSLYVSAGSAKFGEYNGLNTQGWYLNSNLNVQGGDAFTDNQSGGTTRWAVTGNNLGLSDRSASAVVSDQGSWNIGVGYDQLTHNVSNGNKKR